MKIALISLDQKWEDKRWNMQRCTELAARANALGAEIVIFPEMTLTGFSMNTKLLAEPIDASDSVRFFSRLASENNCWLVAGVVMQAGEKAANTLVAFSPEGELRTRYSKIHPFSFAGEDRLYQPGRELATLQLPEFKFGLSICYDLRFPELYSALGKDCEVLVNIANWPKRRVKHWRALLQARAIENQAYMIGVNRVGVDGNGLDYERSSLIVDPNGDFLQPVVSEDEFDIYDLSRQFLDDFRRGFSTRQDRLPNLYKEII